MAALQAEYEKIEDEHNGVDELPDAVDQRLSEIEAAIEALQTRPKTYNPTDIAGAGAFVSIDAEGRLAVDRGYVRPEDESEDADALAGAGGIARIDAALDATDDAAPAPPAMRAAITIAGAGDEEEEDGAIKPEPAIFEAALAAVRCRPAEAFYTDDIAAYVEAGRSHGLDAEVFTTATALRAHLAVRGIRV